MLSLGLARLSPVRLQDRADEAGKPVQLGPPHRRRPAVDAEPTARLVMAQTLIDIRQTNPAQSSTPDISRPLAITDKGT